MTAMIPKTFLLLFLSLSSAAFAGGYDDEDEGRWTVDLTPDGEFVRAVTHGSAVYGHEFGFLLSRPNCEQKIIWLTFTSYELEERAEDTDATFELIAPDARRLIQAPLLAVQRIVPGPRGVRIALFTNSPLEPELTEFLRRYLEMEVRIVAPKWLAKAFDIPQDTFDLTGFTEAEEVAVELCNAKNA